MPCMTGGSQGCNRDLPVDGGIGGTSPSFLCSEEFLALIYTSGPQCSTVRVFEVLLTESFSPNDFIAEIAKEGFQARAGICNRDPLSGGVRPLVSF